MQPFFFFKPSPTPVIYTLSLHDALPICRHDRLRRRCLRREPHVIADRIGDDDGIRRRYTPALTRSEEHTSELQSLTNLVCRLLLEKKKTSAISDKSDLELWVISGWGARE